MDQRIAYLLIFLAYCVDQYFLSKRVRRLEEARTPTTSPIDSFLILRIERMERRFREMDMAEGQMPTLERGPRIEDRIAVLEGRIRSHWGVL